MSLENFQKIYFTSDFVSLSTGSVNLETLTVELAVAMPTDHVVEFVGVNTVRVSGSVFPPESEVDAADAAIAAHTGAATSGLLQTFISAGETTNATTAFVDKGADFVSLPLSAGRWGLRFGAQLRTTTTVVNSGVRAIMRAGFGASLAPADDREYTDHSVFSATAPQLWTYTDVFPVTAGQVLRFQPRFARSGAAATAAMLQFRADLFRIGD